MSKHKFESKKAINRTTSECLRLAEAPRKNKIQSSNSFQVTAVSVTRQDGDDSADDLDTDDISRVTDNETPSFSEDSRADDHQEVMEQKVERFKIVKVPSAAPINRGRWVCVDFFDEERRRVEGKTLFAPPVDSSHGPSMPQNPELATKPKVFPQGYPQIPKSTANGQKDDILLSDIKDALTSVPAANSGSAPNNNIDRKIEEALDAVKSHLMVAVHKEVEFLRTRVSTLEGRVNELEVENSILRVNYLLFKS